jgi:Ser-tRNA(Ala) deacylase AlaX
VPTIPAYERDPRRRTLRTEVVSVGEEDGHPFVVLADTVFYPGGGGQPADRGSVGGVAVVDVRKADQEIRHLLAGPPPTGTVTVELDWTRRFDHMQQHTGQHLLTAVADGSFGWPTTSFHLGEHVCDIELDTSTADARRLTELEDAVADEIRAARPVTARRVRPAELETLPVRTRGLPDGHTGDVRLVEIEGVDLNTCGGTHCRSTSEIEALKLLGTESVRGGTRLFWVAGTRLRRLLGSHHRRSERLHDLLGTSDEDLVDRLSAKLEQLKEAERARRRLEEELADTSAAALVGGGGRVLVRHWPARDLPFLQRVAREACRLAPDRVVLLTAGEGEDGPFVLAAGDAAQLDVAATGRRLADLLEGRGGGSGRIFQGKAQRLSRREEAKVLLGSGSTDS